jgi:long-chain acyl-CoA synthetase
LKDQIFITGATGFLGTKIAERLIENSRISLILLIRGDNYDKAVKHLSRSWWESETLMHELKQLNTKNSRILILNGDVTKDSLGLNHEDYRYLVENITHVIHAAADLRLNISIEELNKINLLGTQNMVDLALRAKNFRLKKFSHISTAYVAGKTKGFIGEDFLSSKNGFKTNYEHSKFEAEKFVKKADLPFVILRPGMIVGDSHTGYIKTFNTIYSLIRLYMNGLRLFPISKNLKINLVPVDYVTDAVCSITLNEQSEGKTFHLTAPDQSNPTVHELVSFVRKWSAQNLGLKLPNPLFLPLYSVLPVAEKFLDGEKGIGRVLHELKPYMKEERVFDTKNTALFMGKYNLDWNEYLPQLLNYASYYGFFHRSTRTVHEQIIYRLNSKSLSVVYYDINEGNYIKLNPSNFKDLISKILIGFKAMGIKKGDRISIAGFNSSRYLALDVAIGLLGAVSVPIYYTSPVDEINDILNDCNASIIFLGTPELLDNSEKINIPVVSFYKNYKPGPKIVSWAEFLNPEADLLSEDPSKIIAPVDFSDTATIRYTSGTTGKPAGVSFTHGNLRWMAEFIASMPPWSDRTDHIKYLSFLPMNHVVEGILGTYSPYYAPASLEIYFLENFHELETALPKVRPTILFSVPRFYEKIWSKLQRKWLGHVYQNTRNDRLKRMYGKILKRFILKIVGLDRCAQLIVGSAPISEDLLYAFHEIGIEIHNAYGLTEAPLITINRLGSNIIGTVGTPLPETHISTTADGEIIVKGPQLTSGYHNNNSKNQHHFKEGWFLTGDYGQITENGSLVITGRKKEMIVNSYGKSIRPLKVEGMIKLLEGVSEVMLVGDQKPYCTAMIWVDETFNPNNFKKDIQGINQKLSNPERIKKWMVMKAELSIEHGDITANLKIKRQNILKKHESSINMIYNKAWEDQLKQNSEIIYYGEDGEDNGH